MVEGGKDECLELSEKLLDEVLDVLKGNEMRVVISTVVSTQIVVLESMDKEDAKRLLDFLIRKCSEERRRREIR